ncbi:hypothetical protein [Methylobacterium sp. WL6]|uniref:hypothetical protein n=1 Tax=Methylobacterium sp. WL6 TaxID=2603901 RepID=UPI0011CB0391|nr:hypothetical protein [Methylobacterium sp. WL6]TXN72025.1 hypothetical protein FV230_06280 [Methylobacterium sp. WL6]
MNLRLQPVQVATGSGDQESRLVFADGFLAAVLVQLSDQHGEDAGKWFLEAGFGALDDPRSPLFADLDAARIWIEIRLANTKESAP